MVESEALWWEGLWKVPVTPHAVGFCLGKHSSLECA